MTEVSWSETEGDPNFLGGCMEEAVAFKNVGKIEIAGPRTSEN